MRVWASVALFAWLGCGQLSIGRGDDQPTDNPITGPVVAPPDPDFKWVGAVSSYTAIEITEQVNQPKPGVTFSPAAVGSDGSFVSYEFWPSNALVEGLWPTSYVLVDAQYPSEYGS